MSLTNQIRYVRALDSTATDGSGKTALPFGDITAKLLVQGGTLVTLTTETIITLGTYQAPTDADHIRIKELDSSDPTKGVYEVHFHNDQVAAAGGKLWLFLSASGAAFAPLEMDLTLNIAAIQAAADAAITANTLVGDIGDNVAALIVSRIIRSNLTATYNATDTTIAIDGAASNVDDAYKGLLILLGTGEVRTVAAYNGTTTIITVDRPLLVSSAGGGQNVYTLLAANSAKLGDDLSVTGGSGPSAATIAAAVRDVNNTSPASNSLGAGVNAIYGRIGAAGAGLTAVQLTVAYDAAKTTAQVGSAMNLATGAITSSKFSIGTINAAATGLLERLSWLIKRFWNKNDAPHELTATPANAHVYDDDNTTVLTTQAVSDDGTTQTIGKVS